MRTIAQVSIGPIINRMSIRLIYIYIRPEPWLIVGGETIRASGQSQVLALLGSALCMLNLLFRVYQTALWEATLSLNIFSFQSCLSLYIDWTNRHATATSVTYCIYLSYFLYKAVHVSWCSAYRWGVTEIDLITRLDAMFCHCRILMLTQMYASLIFLAPRLYIPHTVSYIRRILTH
jgi:hypothetical protein